VPGNAVVRTRLAGHPGDADRTGDGEAWRDGALPQGEERLIPALISLGAVTCAVGLVRHPGGAVDPNGDAVAHGSYVGLFNDAAVRRTIPEAGGG